MTEAIEFNFLEAGYSAPTDLDFDFGATTVIVLSVLAGTSTDFNSIWADPTASIGNAKFYVASRGNGAAFSVVDAKNYILVDSYTLTEQGEHGEFLDSEDVIDINVSTAGA